MRIPSFAHKRLALSHAELVLLIDDDEAEIRHREAGFYECVRADGEGGLRRGARGERRS